MTTPSQLERVPSLPGVEPQADQRAHRLKLIVCFAVIYLVWGSSYLAMRIGVRHLAPTLFAGVRFTPAWCC